MSFIRGMRAMAECKLAGFEFWRFSAPAINLFYLSADGRGRDLMCMSDTDQNVGIEVAALEAGVPLGVMKRALLHYRKVELRNDKLKYVGTVRRR
jgi:hypothetical protein